MTNEEIKVIAQKAIDAKQAPLTPKEAYDLALQIVIDEQVEKVAAELGFKESAKRSEQ